MSKLSRREARICAVKMLYCADFQKSEDKAALFDMTCAESETEYNDFSKELFFGASENAEKIDAVIAENTKGWKFERISRISLAVMRLCTYELLFTDTPAAIVINEAIEIDKAFDSDEAPAFINGVLNAIAKSKDNK
ncbi:MAG: transcription antitermination factor NusB [Clostridiales bacterium]|nr:transcription antitermination factor NusB [Clostridiales bacterium]